VAFLGYDPVRIRFLMFALAGLFAGIAGGLYAINYEIVTAFNLGTHASGSVLLMAYIGGVGSFAGPILGAVLVTFLQVSLGGYTEAWQLYLGLIFIVMVMTAPGGLSSILARHAPIARAGRLHRLVPIYLQALPGAVLTVLGTVALVEINYQLKIRVDQGPMVKLLGVAFDANSPASWIGALLCLVIGVALLAWAVPRVRAGWHDILGELHDLGPGASR
jgi:branched-chain amino acid transport system permease protein